MLDKLSMLLRRPFGELYSTHPGTALRLSAAIFATIIHDRVVTLRKDMNSQSGDNWEQLAVVLLAGVQVRLVSLSEVHHRSHLPSHPQGPRGDSWQRFGKLQH
jgi:hypothetical protein